MYRTTVNFKIKPALDHDKQKILEMFFKDWIDNTSIQYTFDANNLHDIDVLRVGFEHQEDATALILKGIPYEFRNYIEIV
jgi:hypothetical protein